jgi:hypothetical protein
MDQMRQPNQEPPIDEAAERERAQREVDEGADPNAVDVDDAADDSPNIDHR